MREDFDSENGLMYFNLVLCVLICPAFSVQMCESRYFFSTLCLTTCKSANSKQIKHKSMGNGCLGTNGPSFRIGHL